MDSCTWFISSYCGGNDVNATSYDADGLEVSQPVTGGTTIYEIKAGNLLEGQCANEIVYIPDTSSSSVTIQNSEEIQRSSPPLGGRVKI